MIPRSWSKCHSEQSLKTQMEVARNLEAVGQSQVHHDDHAWVGLLVLLVRRVGRPSFESCCQAAHATDG